MPSEKDVRMMPSVLDRLIDPESGGTADRRGYSVEEMVAAVQRDLEDLLNTRQGLVDVPEHFTEVWRSILAFGLSDLTELKAVTSEQRDDIGRVLEAAVARFEPRLKDIRAIMADPGDGKERTVKFRIDARLNVDPAPEIAFETILELTTGHYTVAPTSS
jgi:type VI secretion system protein ImpF